MSLSQHVYNTAAIIVHILCHLALTACLSNMRISPKHECISPTYNVYNHWNIDGNITSSFLHKYNLNRGKTYEPYHMPHNRWSTNIILNTKIAYNLNETSNYKPKINPRFFISNSDNYIGVSFDNGFVHFTATSCDGKSSIPYGDLSLFPNTTTSIQYTKGAMDSHSLFHATRIQIEIHSNHNSSNTLVVVKWSNPTKNKWIHESACKYNNVFTNTSNILFRTASAINDDYYRLSDIEFQFCIPSKNQYPLTKHTQHRKLLSSTPAPIDFNYNGCPTYHSKLSDFTPLYGPELKDFVVDGQNYMYLYYNNPIKSSEWLLSTDTKITMSTVNTTLTSLQVAVDIAPLVGCKDPIITIQDTNKFISVLFTSKTVEFYPKCGTILSNIPSPSVYDTFTDPIRNITFDTNNISSTQILKVNEMITVSLIFDIISQTTTALVQRQLNETDSMIDFQCVWNDMFTSNDTFEVLFASSTHASCRIRGIHSTYCDINWKYPLDFCDNTSSITDMSLWSDPATSTIGLRTVHGIFDNNHSPLNVIYNYLPPHVLVHVGLELYIQRSLLSTNDIIDFYITVNQETKLLVTYTGPSVPDTCSLPWSNAAAYCKLTVNSNDFNHTLNSLNMSIFINIRSGLTVFNWAFSSCIHQSFIYTKPPTFTPTSPPTMLPTIMTHFPSELPTNTPTINPSVSPTYNPSHYPTHFPSENPIINPTLSPTNNPTTIPTYAPVLSPTNNPLIVGNTHNPTSNPSNNPTQVPTTVS
eukprot:225448_1